KTLVCLQKKQDISSTASVFLRLHCRNKLPLCFLKNAIKRKPRKMENQPEQQQLNIELNEETADGTYANLAIITHSFAEFVVDFVNVMPGVPKARVKSRVIMTPHHAKKLMRALIDNVKRYESQNGVIKDQEPNSLPFTFGGPTAEA